MTAIPQPADDWPCEAMYHEDEATGTMSLMFERPLTQTERRNIREGILGNSHWADEQTLMVISLETD